MPPIITAGHNLARSPCVWRIPSRLCFPPSGPRPVLRLNTCLALARHQHDSARPPLDPRLRAGLGKKILEKSSWDLEPSPAPVSLDSGFQVISTFNAIRGTASLISVPAQLVVAKRWRLSHPASAAPTAETDQNTSPIGSAPSWKDSKLPVRIPEGVMGPHQARGRPSDQLSMLELSASIKPSEFRYDEVDIVTHAALLGMLFKICYGRNVGFRRISPRMSQGTPFIADDPLMVVMDGSQTALQSAIVEHCAETAPGLEHGVHYRSVQYRLGLVSCVVLDEIDVMCSIALRKLPPSSPNTAESVVGRGSHRRSEPALMRIRQEGARIKGPLKTAFWFSRAPIDLELSISREGNITEEHKIDATKVARRWEKQDKVQTGLRKLSMFLSELQRAVHAAVPDGQECIGIMDRHLDRPTIRLFFSDSESRITPEDIDNKPELGEKSHGQDEALDGERQGPTGPA